MPAKKFLDEFQFDPATFNYDEFKQRLASEIDGDTDLSTNKITALTGERDTLLTQERDLKSRLWDATMMKQGTPVTPNDSPSAGGGTSTATAVKESDIWGDPESI